MMKCFMKSAICFPFGYINGLKYEDGQTSTNKVLFVLQSFKWRIAEPMLDIGGQSQFKSLHQSSVNAFTWNVRIKLFTNLSTVHGPYKLLISHKLCQCQSTNYLYLLLCYNNPLVQSRFSTHCLISAWKN